MQPKEATKALQVIKGCLSSTDSRIKDLMLHIGKERLAYEQSLGGDEMDVGCHLFGLLIQLEALRESVDHFGDAYRLKHDLAPITIRRDQQENRKIFIESALKEMAIEPPSDDVKNTRIGKILEIYRQNKLA